MGHNRLLRDERPEVTMRRSQNNDLVRGTATLFLIFAPSLPSFPSCLSTNIDSTHHIKFLKNLSLRVKSVSLAKCARDVMVLNNVNNVQSLIGLLAKHLLEFL